MRHGLVWQAGISESRLKDAQWVLKLKNGDTSAIGCLIEAHRTGLTTTAFNILRDRAEAEDTAQDAFLKAFREIHRLRDDSAFKNYLYRIAIRLCLDRLRHKKPESTSLDHTFSYSGPDIENRMQIEKVLRRLSPEHRTVLVLREIQQLDYDEIASVMQIPIGTVRSRLHVAREKFRQMWVAELHG